MEDAFDIQEDTYRDMTEEHLGDSATADDLAAFVAACATYQEQTDCTDAEATDYVWDGGSWYPRVDVATPAHTLTPWTIGRGRRWITSGEVDIARIHDVSKIGEAEAIGNAEFIVRACNSYYALLEALENLVGWFGEVDYTDYESGEIDESQLDWVGLHRVFYRAEDAIAKAKGGN
jgi:hypothetical protein